jgi:hypothetical protein
MQIVTKITGDSLTAAEWNQIPDELENLITSSGQAPSAGDLFQVSKAVADYSVSGDYFLDTGAANSYVLGTSGARLAPTSYADGFSIRFRPANANTGASTVNVSGIGVVPITLTDGSALTSGTVLAGDIVNINYNSVAARFELSTAEAQLVQPGVFRGCEIENDGGDADHDIMFNSGVAAATNLSKYLQLSAPLTKRIDGAWASGDNTGGLFSGVVAPNTTYHCFLIEDNVTKDIDCGFDVSVTASNIPIGYTNFARVGSILTDGSANILSFIQVKNSFYHTSPILDSTSLPASPTLVNLTIPSGINVYPIFNARIDAGVADSEVHYASPNNPGNSYVIESDTESGDISEIINVVISNQSSQVIHFYVNTSVVLYLLYTNGWIDNRGRESY